MDIINFFNTQPDIFLIVVGVFSLFVGSFLNVVIYRLPKMLEQNWAEECRNYLGLKPEKPAKRINLWMPFSHCPHCHHTIRPWHNIPLLSYLFLSGKCGYCAAPISFRYPFVEILTCIASLYVTWHFGFSLQTLTALLFTWIAIALIVIDIDFHILPDQLTLLLLWIGLLSSVFNIFCSSTDAIFGAVTGYLIFASIQFCFHLITGKIGMGQGDYKFLAALGALFGWQLLPLIILLSSVTGIILALSQMLARRELKSTPLPFGPYLALSGWVAMLWGNDIMHYYLTLSL